VAVRRCAQVYLSTCKAVLRKPLPQHAGDLSMKTFFTIAGSVVATLAVIAVLNRVGTPSVGSKLLG
jgi:hypothetical protein